MLTDVARLVVEDHQDLQQALTQVARKRGIKRQSGWPSRAALQQAIDDYRSLFHPQQSDYLITQRGLALEAMRTFVEYRPQLVGALVNGDGPLDRIRLLLFADSPEQVILHLEDRGMPWHSTEVSMHFSGGRRMAQPALCFLAGDVTIELIVLNPKLRSDPPRDPVDGGPLAGLDIERLADLLGETR